MDSHAQKQIAIAELLRSDTIGVDDVKDAVEHWDPLVKELADFALNRFGRRNNNWLKIIPLVMHELAGEVSTLAASTHDTTVRVDGQAEWQDTFWNNWKEDIPLTKEEPEIDIDGMSAQAVADRMRQLGEDTEILDPFYEDNMKAWSEKNTLKTDEPTEPEEDPDLLI